MDGGAREDESDEALGNFDGDAEADEPFLGIGGVSLSGGDGKVEACVVGLSVRGDYGLGVEFFDFNFHL